MFRLALTLAMIGCSKDDPNYCPGAPNDNCLAIDAPDPGGCTDNTACAGPTPVCDTASHMCVACTPASPGTCAGTTPVCGTDDACHACTAHADCASSACLPDGSCGTVATVAYVDATGTDSASCSPAQPCRTLAAALATHRPFVKLHGALDEAAAIANQDVSLLADPGAQLTRTQNGIILSISGSSRVAIYDLEVTGASGAAGYGISVPAGSTGSLSLDRVRISNNQAGGVVLDGGGFSIVNSVFVFNGTLLSNKGALTISADADPSNRLDFNSFSKNQAADGLPASVQCAAGVFTAHDNIIVGVGDTQVGGSCKYAYSIVRPGTVPSGAGNSGDDPKFVNTTTGDLHLQSGSPAIGAGDPSADLTGLAARDLDGDARTSPPDIGADQHH